MTGDGKTAIRSAAGIFYNFINRSRYLYTGGPLISRQLVTTLNATYLFNPDGSNVSPNTGKYTATTNPRNVGLYLRLDF